VAGKRRQLRKFITIHKAGLEYPVVFVPLPAASGADKANTHQSRRVDGAGQRHLQLQPSDEDIAADDLERQREPAPALRR
jgi:ATP-dependent exoDNAse (exonuclease V) beta subunit